MLHTLVFTDQHRARYRAIVLVALERLAVADERLNALLVVLQQVPVLLAKSDLLQLVGDASLQKSPMVGRCVRVEQFAPDCTERVDRQVG